VLNDVRAILEPGGLSFAWPVVLLSLLALPALVAGYVALHRRRGREAARFASPDLLPGLLPHRPGWRRHVAPAALLLALAALLVGAARPQRDVERDIRQATVVLAIDSSNSMMAEDVAPNRLEAAKAAARTVVDALPPNGRVGIVSFARAAATLNEPTGDVAVIEASLDALRISGGTAVGDAIVESLGTLEAAAAGDERGAAEAQGAIILLTDGADTEGTIEPLAAARRPATQASASTPSRWGRRPGPSSAPTPVP
jgi:Ca-activated chloride channel family protein